MKTKNRASALPSSLTTVGTVIKKCKPPRPKVSRLEETFRFQIMAQPGFPFYQREYQFDRERRWRFDFCWPSRMVAVELEGGVWSGGRHVRGKGFEEDCRKYSAAALADWKVGRFTTRMVDNGEALAWLRKALATGGLDQLDSLAETIRRGYAKESEK